MTVKFIKHLCKLQGINYNPKIIVICEACRNKAMIIDFKSGKGVCSICEKKTTLEDLIVIWEEDNLNRTYDKLTRQNKGVGGNY